MGERVLLLTIISISPVPARAQRFVASLSVAQPRSPGPVSREAIRAVVQEHVDDVRFCYELGLAARASLTGRVVASFVVDPLGDVVTAGISATTLAEPNVEACILEAVRHFRFPTGDALFGANYPFVLETN